MWGTPRVQAASRQGGRVASRGHMHVGGRQHFLQEKFSFHYPSWLAVLSPGSEDSTIGVVGTDKSQKFTKTVTDLRFGRRGPELQGEDKTKAAFVKAYLLI